MYVLIDIGNTRVKLGLVDTNSSTRLPLTLACPHTDLSPIATWLTQHLTHATAAIGVNVASEALAAQVQALLHAHGIPTVHWQTGDTPYPTLQNSYQHPERLGADRWVSAIGLHTRASATAFLHVSFGTATTVDAILPHHAGTHVFKGGLILPGPQLMQHALHHNTARLDAEHGVLRDFPDHTAAAISSGIAAAQAGAVVRQWLITYQAAGHAPLLFCSGGGKSLVEAELNQTLARMRQLTALALPDPLWIDTPTLDGLAILSTHRA